MLPAIPPPQKHGSPHGSPPPTNLRKPQKQNPRNPNDFKGFCSLAGKGFEPHDLMVYDNSKAVHKLVEDFGVVCDTAIDDLAELKKVLG